MHQFIAIAALAVLTVVTAHPSAQVPLRPVPSRIEGIPLLGLGTWNLKGKNVSDAVSFAIQTGYRHIDCAVAYGNQQDVGAGIREGLVRANLTREDIWVTSKLWNDRHSVDAVEGALEQTLQELGLDYLDLWHMHWPVAHGVLGDSIEYLNTWAAMVNTLSTGKVRHLGVSNFSPKQLTKLINSTNVIPQVHQMELHPYLEQSDWVDVHEKLGIHVTAYSPLAGTNPTYNDGDLPPLLQNKVIKKIAKKRGCSPAQVALKWGLSRGTSVIPKSIHHEYIAENYLALDCKLQRSDIKKINALGEYRNRFNNPSVDWEVELFEDLEDSKGDHKAHS